MTLELSYSDASLLLRVLREGLVKRCGNLEEDDEDRVKDIRDELLEYLTQEDNKMMVEA